MASEKHILVALVANKPGVLNRVASLFRRRNFNRRPEAARRAGSAIPPRSHMRNHMHNLGACAAGKAAGKFRALPCPNQCCFAPGSSCALDAVGRALARGV